jgi:hypothetical protein
LSSSRCRCCSGTPSAGDGRSLHAPGQADGGESSTSDGQFAHQEHGRRRIEYAVLPEISAAAWSAVAATCSAIAASLTYFIHRRNMLDAARPELIIEGWARGTRSLNVDTITLTKIRNVGRGSALHVMAQGSRFKDRKPIYLMSAATLSIVAPSDSADMNAEIVIFWKSVPEDNGLRLLGVKVVLLSWDLRGHRHATTYRLVVQPSDTRNPIAGVSDVVPGVGVLHRTTRSRPVWRLRVMNRFRRVPGLRRLIPGDSDLTADP